MKLWVSRTMTAGLSLTWALSGAAAATTSRVGALEYVEGSACIDGKPVKANQDRLPILGNGATLSTAMGHAEMLLTPGVFLRLDGDSEARLASASLTDTRVQLNRGAAMLEPYSDDPAVAELDGRSTC